MDRILKIVSFSERVHYQCPTPHGHGEIQIFQKFQKIADGGPRRINEKFWRIEKRIIDLYELDNSKKKIFFEKKFSK